MVHIARTVVRVVSCRKRTDDGSQDASDTMCTEVYRHSSAGHQRKEPSGVPVAGLHCVVSVLGSLGRDSDFPAALCAGRTLRYTVAGSKLGTD